MDLHLNRFRACRLPLLGKDRLRIAQLTAAHAFESAELFPPQRWRKLEAYSPNILIGSTADLQRLVERVDLHTVRLTSLDHSIYVLTEVGDKPLTDVVRVVLWQRFGVPVYELYTDGRGSLLAFECEAHEGWHVEPNSHLAARNGELVWQSTVGNPVRTGLPRHLVMEACACGRAGARMVESTSDLADNQRPVLAAIA